MKILAFVPAYPYSGHPFSGIFNERCVTELNHLTEHIEVLAPRPYFPPILHFIPRWAIYSNIKVFEKRNGIQIHRPPLFQIPKLGNAFVANWGGFIQIRNTANKIHQNNRFDLILSFDLLGTGGMAWRLGRLLGIPAIGWATGSDVRIKKDSPFYSELLKSLRKLDLIFYQSHELRDIVTNLLKKVQHSADVSKHIVLSRGIPLNSMRLFSYEKRQQFRKKHGIRSKNIFVLYVGRIVKSKGVFDLVEAISIAQKQNSKIICKLIGAIPGFDESHVLNKIIRSKPDMENKIELLPPVAPTEVKNWMQAADIYAFPSFNEGMPNSVLEALSNRLPTVAYDIPAIREINHDQLAILTAPLGSPHLFSERLLQICRSKELRQQLINTGIKRVKTDFNISKQMEKVITISKNFLLDKG